ncbi:RHO1 GDP-GTP exchange protein 2 [Actinomortierella ambigua]|nr:RHO1 GDP-GTP exchange protein 2 [Actinomortierella ambigua]
MAFHTSYTTPPDPNGNNGTGLPPGSRVNPLAPIQYTPKNPYQPSHPSRTATQRRDHRGRSPSSASDLSTYSSSTSTTITSGGRVLETILDNKVLPPPPVPGNSRPSLQHDLKQFINELSSEVNNLQIASPPLQPRPSLTYGNSPSDGGYTAPASLQHQAPVAAPHQQQQQHSHHQQPHQQYQYQAPYQQHQHQTQQYPQVFAPASDHADLPAHSNPYGVVQAQPYPQPSRHPSGASTASYSMGYSVDSSTTYGPSSVVRSSTGSIASQNSWSQPSSPGFPPPHQGAGLGYNSSSDQYSYEHRHQYPYQYQQYVSEEARQLIDFNPGILSTIAVAFREKMLQNEVKRSESVNYGLEFPVTFTGKEAIDVIIELTNVDDRRHGLAIARSLERQLLFFGGGLLQVLFDSNSDQYFFSEATLAYNPGKDDFPTVPTGVFPYSTACYSPRCHPGAPCYSYLCPNRKSVGSILGRQNSDVSTSSQEKVWANSVPASVVEAASKQERNRQEAIFEVIQTEANYCRDLELLDEIFINPLRAGGIVDPSKVESLIEDVFMNYQEIRRLNKNLLAALRERQAEQPLVEAIGDVLLPHIMGFEKAYMEYVPRIALSEFAHKKEEASNPKFAKFLQECSRHPEARRLGLHHFVGQPYQRIPRYPLLLKEVIKRTDESVGDRAVLQEVIRVCTELGKNIDSRIPETNKKVRLLKMQDKIVWKTGEVPQDLKLDDKNRKLHYECIVKRKSNHSVQVLELRLFVFDHLLLMTKEKRDKMASGDDRDAVVYQVSKKPIPLELLHVVAEDGRPISMPAVGQQQSGNQKLNASMKSNVSNGGRNPSFQDPNKGPQETKFVCALTLEHRGRRGGSYVIYALPNDRDELLEHINLARAARQESVSNSNLFLNHKIAQLSIYPSAQPMATNALDGKRITCSAPYYNVIDAVRRVVIGTDEGVYVGVEDGKSMFRLAVRGVNATQVSVLDHYHILLVLDGKYLRAYNLSVLDEDADESLQNGQTLGRSVQFFSAGQVAGKTLVISMKRKGAGESHFSAYEPIENAVLGGHHQRGFSLPFGKRSKSDWFKLHREFYVGSESFSLQMLSKMVCVVCPKGFDIVMLDHLERTQVFPPRSDPSYAFLDQRESTPVSMFRINQNHFLMCYTDFAFIMTKTGELVNKKDLIEWEGRPESFAIAYPYVLAFEDSLIEIRHVETGSLEQIILGKGIKRLYANVDIKGNAVIHVLMSNPQHSTMRQVYKLVRAPSPPSLPSGNEYIPRGPFVPEVVQPHPPPQPVPQQHTQGPTHLMGPPVQPSLSLENAGPAVLASHTHPSIPTVHHPHPTAGGGDGGSIYPQQPPIIPSSPSYRQGVMPPPSPRLNAANHPHRSSWGGSTALSYQSSVHYKAQQQQQQGSVQPKQILSPFDEPSTPRTMLSAPLMTPAPPALSSSHPSYQAQPQVHIAPHPYSSLSRTGYPQVHAMPEDESSMAPGMGSGSVSPQGGNSPSGSFVSQHGQQFPQYHQQHQQQQHQQQQQQFNANGYHMASSTVVKPTSAWASDGFP